MQGRQKSEVLVRREDSGDIIVNANYSGEIRIPEKMTYGNLYFGPDNYDSQNVSIKRRNIQFRIPKRSGDGEITMEVERDEFLETIYNLEPNEQISMEVDVL